MLHKMLIIKWLNNGIPNGSRRARSKAEEHIFKAEENIFLDRQWGQSARQPVERRGQRQ
jgi:hypothetical protein